MRLTKYYHSCFLLEEGSDKILFDPGIFCFMEGRTDPEIFKNLQAIFITHNHPDHLDISALKKVLINNPGVSIFTNTDTQETLNKENIACTVFETGEKKIGSFYIRAIEATHEQLLIPVPQNTAYLVNGTFLATGDSLDYSLRDIKGVKVLALPILAPWGKVSEIAEFAQSVQPGHIIPCHDGFVLDGFLERQYGVWKNYYEGGYIDFRPLAPGEAFEF
ncbi:MAG: MBL fold metallo-hydrolase [Patescibacteria group bacterium]